jgi:L-asparaginase
MQALNGVGRRTSPARIVVLGTGGTIAGLASTAGDNLAYAAAQLGVSQLLEGMGLPDSAAVLSEQVAQVDSKDIDVDVWRALALRCAHWLADDDVQGIVVTHGTDTVEETAYLLQVALSPSKPVVLACAMRPANALMPDGPQNLRDALTVAVNPEARGVMVVCAGVVHGALDVRKLHTYRLDAFGSGDAGPIGYVEEGKLRQLRPWPASPGGAVSLIAWPSDPASWPRVEIVTSHAGASGRLVEALVRDGVHGIVVAGSGNGGVHQALEEALMQAQAAGVRVLRCSRCDQGEVMERADEQLPGAGCLSAVKARIQLMLALMR